MKVLSKQTNERTKKPQTLKQALRPVVSLLLLNLKKINQVNVAFWGNVCVPV